MEAFCTARKQLSASTSAVLIRQRAELKLTGQSICTSCQKTGTLSEFNSKTTICKTCHSRDVAAYKQANRDKFVRIQKTYRQNHPARIQDAYKLRKATNAGFAMLERCRARLAGLIREANTTKSARTNALIGCSAEQLVRAIEGHFQTGMTWENRALWHIDHILPCAKFDMTDPAAQRMCFHWTNLRPLWSKDNVKRQDTVIDDDIVLYMHRYFFEQDWVTGLTI